MDELPTDTVAPWTIKAVPTELRNRVIKAARQEGLTVSQWLERHVNEWLDEGGPVHVSPDQPGSASALVRVGPNRMPQGDLRISELRELVQLARDLSPSPEDTLLRLARSTVRERLRALKG